MRTPIARFPFIISLGKKNREGETGDTTLLSSLQNLGEELKVLISGNKENFSLVLKKMVFLESALDELLEAEPSEKDERVTHSLLEPEQQKMKKFFIGLIPILDSLDAACSSAVESEEPELNRGLQMFDRKLMLLLSSRDFLKSADPGMKFNPQFHEAVGTGISSSLEPGSILDIIENGWTFEGKVLRFAKVIVVK